MTVHTYILYNVRLDVILDGSLSNEIYSTHFSNELTFCEPKKIFVDSLYARALLCFRVVVIAGFLAVH